MIKGEDDIGLKLMKVGIFRPRPVGKDIECNGLARWERMEDGAEPAFQNCGTGV